MLCVIAVHVAVRLLWCVSDGVLVVKDITMSSILSLNVNGGNRFSMLYHVSFHGPVL